MNLQQLEYLVALDQHGQFGRAADHAFVTQPALSMQVQKLEEELGVRLFERTRRGTIPTPVGAKVIAQARAALQAIRQLRDVVQAEKGEMVGDFRLGVIPTLAPYLLPLLLPALTAAYPGLYVRVEELQTADLTERLLDHRLDVGLLVTPLDFSALREIPVLAEPFLLYVHPDHPLAAHHAVRVADLDLAQLWLLQQGHCFRSQVLNLCTPARRQTTTATAADQAAGRPFTYESGSIETLKQLVARHGGYTLVPELSVLTELDHNAAMIKRFEAPAPVREVSLVAHSSFVRLPLLEFLRTTLLAQLPERLHTAAAGRRIRWQ